MKVDQAGLRETVFKVNKPGGASPE